MNRRTLILGALVLTMPFVGCQSADKLLDVTSPTTVSDEIFWTQENDAVLTLNGVYATFFGAPPPARSTFAVGALPKGGLVEIEAIAVRPTGG